MSCFPDSKISLRQKTGDVLLDQMTALRVSGWEISTQPSDNATIEPGNLCGRGGGDKNRGSITLSVNKTCVNRDVGRQSQFGAGVDLSQYSSVPSM
ncbi:hypothetical protein J6590_100903 [Homalodisca vitripennis]|nr:hypothetical protein J6590_084583 [Homalodisca vitripennis]KAG8299445.1 hypothetical protein J6590_100903 [Homalodisca vitripennis]